MPLYVRDDGVKQLADQLAATSRCTVTEAVRDALSRRLQQLADDRAERGREIDALLAEFDAEPDLAPGFTDKDLYDEDGLPIL